MNRRGCTEGHLVEQPAIQLMQHEPGWDAATAFDGWSLGASPLGREAKREVVPPAHGRPSPPNPPMHLFPPDPGNNLLPCDGIAEYHGPILAAVEADTAFRNLRDTIAWRHDEVVLFGKRIVTARMVAWYGDRDYAYVYSGTERRALPWTEELLGLKAKVEAALGERFNSCLLNLYHDGSESMGWHSDDESTLVEDAAIASLSLGAERKFVLRHKRRREEKVSILLEHGSLLAMLGETQRHWTHALPKTKRVTEARINLTFRLMKER